VHEARNWGLLKSFRQPNSEIPEGSKTMRRIPAKQQNSLVAREADQGAVARFALLLCCGLALAAGFVYAGGQHFAALRFGYETEKLRNIKEELEEEQHRLQLERESAASPGRLEQAARRIGMQPMQATQIDPLKLAVKSYGEAATPTEVEPVAKGKPRSGKGAPAKVRWIEFTRSQSNLAIPWRSVWSV
jgi:cell division protein FtsL